MLDFVSSSVRKRNRHGFTVGPGTGEIAEAGSHYHVAGRLYTRGHRAASEGVAESSALHGEQKQASKADELHCGLNAGNLPCRCSKK